MFQKYFFSSILMLITFALMHSCTTQSSSRASDKDYPITPIPFTAVHLQDNFWMPRILKNTEVTIPIAFKQSEETGRINNFEIAGGIKSGSFCSKYGFDDSDVYKIIEGASYSLMIKADLELEAYLDSLIYKISLAQESDGYLYTNRTIMGDSALEMAGKHRWEKIEDGSHELYNLGHLYEAAVAYYQATGKRTLLDVAIKSADLIDKEFGWGKIEKYPGHQEIEIGLVKLYRVTGDKKYLDLAKFFLDVRGPEGWEYNQAHKKVVDQHEAVGHAVRALYLYSAMADIAALTGDTAYFSAISAIWENVVNKKMYITGGIGQSGSNEGFGPDYELPNLSAYCETCASIANVFWNERMFLLTGESKYIDVMERTMYNALLSGVSLSGNRFFYPNPLESNGKVQRKAWFGCACCPSNITRFLPSVPGYIYAHRDNEIYINLYISSEAEWETEEGKIKLSQQSVYPWDGDIEITVEPEKKMSGKLMLRVPGWAMNKPVPGELYSFYSLRAEKPILKINDAESGIEPVNGYIAIEREWKPGDRISLHFDMPIRKVLASNQVIADQGRFALQRGPLVYCLEEVDNSSEILSNVITDIDGTFYNALNNNFLTGLETISFNGIISKTKLKDESIQSANEMNLTAIPYAFWANRTPGRMLVWIPYKEFNSE